MWEGGGEDLKLPECDELYHSLHSAGFDLQSSAELLEPTWLFSALQRPAVQPCASPSRRGGEQNKKINNHK